MDKHLIARWESRGGKDWVELWHDEFGYSYRGNGCRGWFGEGTTLRQAMTFMEREAASGMQVFCSQPVAMRRVEVACADR
jgi:hypothetical protein